MWTNDQNKPKKTKLRRKKVLECVINVLLAFRIVGTLVAKGSKRQWEVTTAFLH